MASLDPSTPSGLLTELGETAAAESRLEAHGERRLEPRVAAGDRVGRYLVLAKLGAGAMGVVFAAYDPELDRKIAVKLLVDRGGDREAARARLQREAQALAKLDHRNVVRVYDVGVHDNQLFVGMEYVEGRTLGAWMRAAERPRPWAEVVSVFLDAGRGLAAAHAAGLVHRDFKPDNVMLGDDGRARVMDFGLARTAGDERAATDPAYVSAPAWTSTQELDRSARALAVPLTQTGAVMGTPAYMAPEQFRGEQADARSDQFGFCVALYEALYGERPFAAETVAQLLAAVTDGVVRPAPRDVEVPAWLRRAVLRGLATDPALRWPSLDHLLAALADDPALRRRRRFAAGLGVALVAGLAWAVASVSEAEAQTCRGMDAHLVGVWDQPRKAEVAAGFAAAEVGHADSTWLWVEARLDDYTQAWVRARERACEAGERGEQSSALLDRRMACLDERLLHLRATVDVLAEADADVVGEVVEMVSRLPTLDRCADIDALVAEQPPPEDPAVARRVAELREQLVEAETLQHAGKLGPALELAAAIASEAEALGYEPLQARAWLRLGELEDAGGDYERAQQTLARSYEAALSLAMVQEAGAAATDMMWLVGERLDRHDEARHWARDARSLARQIGTEQAEADYLNAMAAVELSDGHYALARELRLRALELDIAIHGPDHPKVAGSLNGLGAAALQQAELALAREALERARTILEATLGPEHPDVAAALNNLGLTAEQQGELGEARELHERARAIREASLGPNHPLVANSLDNLGIVASRMGEPDQAREHMLQALAIREAVYEPNNPIIANSLGNLGVVATQAGDYEGARDYLERALAIKREALGPNHLRVATSLSNLGEVYGQLGDHARALELHTQALAIQEAGLGPDHPDLGFVLVGIGHALLGLGRAGEALAPLERALILRTDKVGDSILAETWFVLAQALWDAPAGAGRDRGRARELAEQARSTFEQAGDGFGESRDEVASWLAAHR